MSESYDNFIEMKPSNILTNLESFTFNSELQIIPMLHVVKM